MSEISNQKHKFEHLTGFTNCDSQTVIAIQKGLHRNEVNVISCMVKMVKICSQDVPERILVTIYPWDRRVWEKKID